MRVPTSCNATYGLRLRIHFNAKRVMRLGGFVSLGIADQYKRLRSVWKGKRVQCLTLAKSIGNLSHAGAAEVRMDQPSGPKSQVRYGQYDANYGNFQSELVTSPAHFVLDRCGLKPPRGFLRKCGQIGMLAPCAWHIEPFGGKLFSNSSWT